jgi:hypothetical protein
MGTTNAAQFILNQNNNAYQNAVNNYVRIACILSVSFGGQSSD